MDLVSVAFYTIPTSISFSQKKFLKFYFAKFLEAKKHNIARVYMSSLGLVRLL